MGVYFSLPFGKGRGWAFFLPIFLNTRTMFALHGTLVNPICIRVYVHSIFALSAVRGKVLLTLAAPVSMAIRLRRMVADCVPIFKPSPLGRVWEGLLKSTKSMKKHYKKAVRNYRMHGDTL